MAYELARGLLLSEVVGADALARALFVALSNDSPLERALLDTSALDPVSLEAQLGRSTTELGSVVVDIELMDRLPAGLCSRLLVVPVGHDLETNTVDIAAVNVLDDHAAREIAFHLGATVVVHRVKLAVLEAALGDRPSPSRASAASEGAQEVAPPSRMTERAPALDPAASSDAASLAYSRLEEGHPLRDRQALAAFTAEATRMSDSSVPMSGLPSPAVEIEPHRNLVATPSGLSDESPRVAPASAGTPSSDPMDERVTPIPEMALAPDTERGGASLLPDASLEELASSAPTGLALVSLLGRRSYGDYDRSLTPLYIPRPPPVSVRSAASAASAATAARLQGRVSERVAGRRHAPTGVWAAIVAASRPAMAATLCGRFANEPEKETNSD